MRAVLVIEDDRDLVAILAVVLSGSGYRVRTAGDGREALERVAEEMPGLILLDMRMPRMNGSEFAREFYATYGRACPIIVMTAAENSRARAREVGADGWLSKPFDIDQVIAAAGRYLPAPSSDGDAGP